MDFFFNNIEFFVFIVLLSIFLFIKRKNLEIHGTPILYMMLYKTSLGLDKMKSWAEKFPRFYLFLARLSYIVGVWGLLIGIFILLWSLYIVIEQNLPSGGGLVLPIQTESGMESAVPVFYVPFWYWLVALFILVVVHEFAHGVIARRFNIPVKSSGFAFLGVLVPILPAAFVEPDEKVMSKKSRREQISVLGAGSTSNFIFGFLFLLVWIFVSAPFLNMAMEPDEFHFSSVMDGSSLKDYNIESGSIVGVNGETSAEEIFNILMSLEINETYVLDIRTVEGVERVNVTTFAHTQDSSRGMLGISGLEYGYISKDSFSWLGELPLHIHQLLFYIWLLNIGIGLMNLLPLWITDGGKISYLLFNSWFSESVSGGLTNLLSFMTLLLVIVTIWPGLLTSFFS